MLKNCFSFQQSIKSQRTVKDGKLTDDCFSFQQSIKSQPSVRQVLRWPTVSHFNRASNHNSSVFAASRSLLFLISIEHQITTYSFCLAPTFHCFSFQQSIKSQPCAHVLFIKLHCFSFQQSIKSQRNLRDSFAMETVSHFNRASNHNRTPGIDHDPITVSHFNRASNHNRPFLWADAVVLFLISIEHQITTTNSSIFPRGDCLSFQQSIKSQRFRRCLEGCKYCFSFQQSIKLDT